MNLSPELQLQVVQFLNAGATITALVLSHLANKRSKQRKQQPASNDEPVTMTGVIRVLRYLENMTRGGGDGKHSRDADKR